MIVCSGCGKDDTQVNFSKITGTNRPYSKCNPCRHKGNKKRTEDQRRDSHYKAVYGIDIATYEALLDDQNHMCAICGIHQSKLRKRLAVDHCHVTCKVRGLLCYSCNVAIGLLAENPDTLRRAALYIERDYLSD